MSNYNKPIAKAKFYLPDWIDARVTAIQSNSLPIFRVGYWNELREINSNVSRATSNKYPIVYLPVNFTYNFLNSSSFFEANFELYIITSSNKNYSYDSRLDSVIKTTLEPIYTDLIEEIRDNEYLKRNDRVINHEKEYLTFDKGQSQNQNQLNEVIEAIHLTFNSFEFNNLQNL